MTRVIGVFVINILALTLVAGAAVAAAPEWSAGFPSLAKKNALLQWDPVKGATEYKVYKTEKKDKDLKLMSTVKANRHIDRDLPAGKTYYYYVTAVVDGKEGERSVAGPVTTEAEKVFVPLKEPKIVGGHIKYQAGDKASVGLRWEGAKGSELVGVNIYRSKTSGKGYALIGSTASDTMDDTDVKRGETYYYVATSVDTEFNETGYSNEYKVDVPAVEKPAEKKKKADVQPTVMKPATLLFRITDYKATSDKTGKIETFETKGLQDVVVDEGVGHIYVTSYDYNGVLVYDMEGRFQFTIRKDGVSGKQKFKSPVGIALGSNGYLYVAEFAGNTVRYFSFDGKPKGTITVEPSEIKRVVGQKAMPTLYDVAVDDDGYVYMTDPANMSIHIYDSQGKHFLDIGQNMPKKLDTYFNGPTFLAIDKAGDITLVDTGSARLMVYDKDGKFLRTISKRGDQAGMLDAPVGLAVDKNGMIYVASALTPNIQAFSADGKFQYALCNENCDGPLDIGSVRGIYLDSQDRLYVAESAMNRLSVYQLKAETVKVLPEE